MLKRDLLHEVLFVDFYEVVLKRRSIRKFREEPTPEEALNKVLEAGRWAPSAGNTQPWRFIVITDFNVKGRIAKVCTEFSRKAWAEFPLETARYLVARGGSWDKSNMAKVPILIAVCFQFSRKNEERVDFGFGLDCC